MKKITKCIFALVAVASLSACASSISVEEANTKGKAIVSEQAKADFELPTKVMAQQSSTAYIAAQSKVVSTVYTLKIDPANCYYYMCGTSDGEVIVESYIFIKDNVFYTVNALAKTYVKVTVTDANLLILKGQVQSLFNSAFNAAFLTGSAHLNSLVGDDNPMLTEAYIEGINATEGTSFTGSYTSSGDGSLSVKFKETKKDDYVASLELVWENYYFTHLVQKGDYVDDTQDFSTEVKIQYSFSNKTIGLSNFTDTTVE